MLTSRSILRGAPLLRFRSRTLSSTMEDIHPALLKAPYTLPNHQKIRAPAMVYISGEEMTHYTMNLILDSWIKPHVDTSAWEFYDLSCKSRDDTDDQVLTDAVSAGARICSIFKEPTITPSAKQVKEFGLKKGLRSPNGMMRKGWNGITISRDTIHIDGIKLGFEKPVFMERHAIGGEYGAGYKTVGRGRVVTNFFPEDGSSPVIVDDRLVEDQNSAVVVYHNPLDNVEDLAHIFFKRCLEASIVPYVVTKKTVFKWQEEFWIIMKDVFDNDYKEEYMKSGLIPDGELQHLISDAATMQILRWTDGGFGMALHNYDGDMLSDELAQVHRSPGFITSNLVGKREDGTIIREFEASHGTVTDLYHAMQRGEETSLNPLGMAEALIGAMEHSAKLKGSAEDILRFTSALRSAMHNTFRYGQGTKDLAGVEGLSTEAFIDKVAWRLGRYVARYEEEITEELKKRTFVPSKKLRRNYNVDKDALKDLFAKYDSNADGTITLDELEEMLVNLSVAPLADPNKRGSASIDTIKEEE